MSIERTTVVRVECDYEPCDNYSEVAMDSSQSADYTDFGKLEGRLRSGKLWDWCTIRSNRLDRAIVNLDFCSGQHANDWFNATIHDTSILDKVTL